MLLTILFRHRLFGFHQRLPPLEPWQQDEIGLSNVLLAGVTGGDSLGVLYGYDLVTLTLAKFDRFFHKDDE
jgi:hypothetical protein